MSNAAPPASTAEAMNMVLAGLSYPAAADPTTLPAQAQAECLQAFEQADAISTAARAWFLGAFTSGQGYGQDADYSPTAWLIHRTKVTRARPSASWAGPAGHGLPAGRRGAGRGRRPDRVDGPDHLRLDRQAPRGSAAPPPMTS